MPAIYRIIKRKRSADYSIKSLLLCLLSTYLWLAYVLLNPTAELVICAVIDNVLMTIQSIVVLKYHKEKGKENK